jgi:hypothetical protein
MDTLSGNAVTLEEDTEVSDFIRGINLVPRLKPFAF